MKINGILVDLNGTLHIENSALPGAIESLKRLQSRFNVKFISNTTKTSSQKLVEQLDSMGFSIQKQNVFTVLTLGRRFIENEKLKPFVIAEEEVKSELISNDLSKTEEYDSVVVGLAPEMFNYTNMNKAFQILMEGGRLIALHKGKYLATSDSISIGPGPIVAALEYAADVQAQVIGKPEKSFFEMLLQELNCDPEECIMIGDDIKDDICGAQSIGINGILVRTGKYRKNDELKYQGESEHMKPWKTFDTFEKAVDFLLTFQES